MTPAQEVILRTWDRLHEEWTDGDWPTSEDDIYGPVDHATARRLDVSLASVGEALVRAGKRPPVWWAG